MLVLICGRSQVGKTTLSTQFENVIHLDEAAKGIRERYPSVIEAVSTQTGDVTVDGIYDTAEKRTALLSAYKGKGRRCIWIDKAVIPCLPRSFQPPTYEEGWDEIIRITAEDTSAF